jgi:cell division septal protein FtsQ
MEQKRRQRVRLRFYLLISAVVAVVVGIVAASHLDAIQINKVTVTGNSVVTTEELLSLAESQLTGSYFFMFPKRNMFLYPHRAIEASVTERYAKIQKATIETEGLKTITLVIRERKPFALWCAGTLHENSDECYFLDEDGLVFAPAPHFTGNVFLRYHGLLFTEDGTAAPKDADPTRLHFLSVAEFQRLTFFLDALKNSGIHPVSLSLTDAMDIDLELENGARLMLSRDQNLSEILDNLESILGTEELSREMFERVEYIDLRFGDRVYYRMRDGE